MSIQENKIFFNDANVFIERKNRFTDNTLFIPKEYNSFCFNGNLKSDNFGDLNFTNFVNSKEKKKYKDLKMLCIELLNCTNALEKHFIADEVKTSSTAKIARLNNIISRVNKEEINIQNQILKFKNREDPEIQLYIQNDDGELKVLLIDLYHLGIEAFNLKIGKWDLLGAYRANKECKYDISNIAIEIEEFVQKGSQN